MCGCAKPFFFSAEIICNYALLPNENQHFSLIVDRKYNPEFLVQKLNNECDMNARKFLCLKKLRKSKNRMY